MVRQRMYEDGGMSDSWRPLTIEEVQHRFARFDVDWWIAGGHAIDLFVGWVTRPHDDIDVEIFRKDSDTLFDVFDGWDLHVVGHGGLLLWVRGTDIAPHVFGVWGRPSSEEPWAVEVMLADGDHTSWRFRRDPDISLPGAELIRTSRTDVPYCTPEVQMLYKSKMARTKDDVDLARTLHLMTRSQRRWLADAIARSEPDHPWIGLLTMPDLGITTEAGTSVT
jgi:hypothetical protein